MADPLLFVPFGEDQNFSLYKVFFTDDDSEVCWSILTVSVSGVNPEMQNKLEDLQEYFEQRHYKNKIGGKFQGINISDGSHFAKITPSTPSIFLGLFLVAAQKIQQRKLMSSMTSITVTGDLDYDHNTGKIKLREVGDIDKKYQAAADYADKCEGRHLFVYINSEEQIPQGVNGNIEVKRFSREDSIFDIMDFIFEPFTHGMENHDLDDTQRRLLNNVNNGQRCKYIAATGYEKNLQKIFSKNWTGFFIHGEGASGKSVMAEALIHDMMRTGRIYAPLWISIKNDEYRSDRTGGIVAAQSNDAGYFIGSIYKQLNIDSDDISAFERIISEKQYLIVFDNLDMDIARLASLLKEIGEFISPFYKNKPFLIITSRNYSDQLAMPNNLEPIMPPELQQGHIESLIHNLAKQGGYLDKIKSEENTEEYRLFLSEIVTRLNSTPGLISPALNMLRKNSVREALFSLRNIKDRGLQEKVIAIYKPSFQYLPIEAQFILFMILNSTKPDEPVSRDELFDGLKERFAMKQEVAEDEDIEESLNTLLDYNFIYRTEDAGKSKYAVKTHCFLVFTFAPEFEGEFDSEEGKSLRDQIMINSSLKLYIALRYDRSRKYVEPILKTLKKNEFDSLHLFTAAEYSSSTGNLELLKNYLKGKIDDMRNENGGTAFLRASGYNPHRAIIQWFLGNLNEKAIFRRNRHGLNALCYAALFNTNPEILKLLVKRGFNPNDRIRKGSIAHFTPFLASLEANANLKICECFIDDLKCDINKLYYGDARKIINDSQIDEGLDKENGDHKNLLRLREFLRNNQDNDVLKKNLKKSVFLPVLSALINPNIKILEKIISSPKFDPERIINKTGTSLLHLAAKTVSRPEIMDLLKKYGYAKINERDTFGLTAFHNLAIINGSIPVFNWFAKNGVDIYAVSDEGLTAFDDALILSPYQEVIEWFINHGVDINAADEEGRTPLHYAVVVNPNPEIYQCLVRHGANINARDKYGHTPLQDARRYKMKDRVKWLKQYAEQTQAPAAHSR